MVSASSSVDSKSYAYFQTRSNQTEIEEEEKNNSIKSIKIKQIGIKCKMC